MNLNDMKDYRMIAFKLKKYYTVPYTVKIRDVFYRFTKDGTRPNQGIQELYILTVEDYNSLLEAHKGSFKRDLVRSYATYSFTVKGEFKLK